MHSTCQIRREFHLKRNRQILPIPLEVLACSSLSGDEKFTYSSLLRDVLFPFNAGFKFNEMKGKRKNVHGG